MATREYKDIQQDLTNHGFAQCGIRFTRFFLCDHVPVICGIISLLADYVLLPEKCSRQNEGNAVGSTVPR